MHAHVCPSNTAIDQEAYLNSEANLLCRQCCCNWEDYTTLCCVWWDEICSLGTLQMDASLGWSSKKSLRRRHRLILLILKCKSGVKEDHILVYQLVAPPTSISLSHRRYSNGQRRSDCCLRFAAPSLMPLMPPLPMVCPASGHI